MARRKTAKTRTTASETKAATTKKVRLTHLMNLRAEPSKEAQVITTMPSGTVLDVTEVLESGWLAVADPDGFVLYDGGKFGELM